MSTLQQIYDEWCAAINYDPADVGDLPIMDYRERVALCVGNLGDQDDDEYRTDQWRLGKSRREHPERVATEVWCGQEFCGWFHEEPESIEYVPVQEIGDTPDDPHPLFAHWDPPQVYTVGDAQVACMDDGQPVPQYHAWLVDDALRVVWCRGTLYNVVNDEGVIVPSPALAAEHLCDRLLAKTA